MSAGPKIKNSIAIEAFSLVTPLGCEKKNILDNALSGSLSGMHKNTEYLQGRETIVGKVLQDLPMLPSSLSEFDYRANHLLAKALSNLSDEVSQLKQRFSPCRIGVIMATSTSGVESLEQALPMLDTTGLWPENYRTHHQRMGGVSQFASCYLGVDGPSMTVSTACSSGNKAIASACRWLNANLCDAVVCGGVDVLSQLTLRGFESLGALSYQHTLPFSHNRMGINIGEGAGAYILTKGEGEYRVLGSGETSDAYHISAPDPTGVGAANAMNQAVISSGLSPENIDYINLHGTGTAHNDPMEAAAIYQVFGCRASSIPCSSSKPQIGHTLGVSGIIELGLSLLSMSDLNIGQHYLPHCYDGDYDSDILPLNLIPPNNGFGRPKYVLSNSFAFGGSNSAVIIGKIE